MIPFDLWFYKAGPPAAGRELTVVISFDFRYKKNPSSNELMKGLKERR
jgi:hypothetical protein